tara:strand:+ start:1153 stop:1359 length:207 start_codon:yes stop_codon:yes gene_type:complete
MKNKKTHLLLGIIFVFASFIGINTAYSFATLELAAEPIKCPDGRDDCAEVETPAGTFYFHKGNPVITQ